MPKTQKSSARVYTLVALVACDTSRTRDTNRPWPADGVDNQLKRDAFADLETVKGRVLAHIGAMEKYLAPIAQANEAIRLPDHQPDDRAIRLRTT